MKILDNDPTKNKKQETPKLDSESLEELRKDAERIEEINKSGIVMHSPDLRMNTRREKFNYSDYTDYIDLDEINLNDIEATNKLRASRQSTREQIGLSVGNLVGNTAVGIIHDIGAIGALASEWGSDRDYTNPITEWAEKNRNPFGEVYSESADGMGWDSGSIINHISGVVQPVIQFGLESILLAQAFKPLSAIGEGMSQLTRAKNVAQAVEKANWATNMTKSVINGGARAMEGFVPQALNSYSIGYFASVDGAHNAYTQAYDHALKNMSIEDPSDATPEQVERAKKFASSFASDYAKFNTMLFGSLNFSLLKPGMQTTAIRNEVLGALKNEEKQMLASQAEAGLNRTISAGNLKEALKGMDEKIASNFVRKGERGIDYAKKAAHGAWVFGAMDILANENTTKKALANYENVLDANKGELPSFLSSVGRMTGYMKAASDELDDIVRGNDPDGAKKLRLSLLTGAAFSPIHSLVNSRLSRTKVYTKDADGNVIPVLNEAGEPTGKYESYKTSKYKAHKVERQRVFDYYKNSLIKDLDVIENADNKLKLIADVGEEEAGITQDEVFRDLFDLQSYEMITRGGKDFLINSLKDVMNVDNTVDMGAKMVEQKAMLDAKIAEIEKIPSEKKTTEQFDELKSLKEQSKDLAEKSVRYSGKSEAMIKGFADEMETKERAGKASKYREKANKLIEDIKYLDSKYKEYKDNFGHGKTAALGLPEFLLKLEQNKLTASNWLKENPLIDNLTKGKDESYNNLVKYKLLDNKLEILATAMVGASPLEVSTLKADFDKTRNEIRETESYKYRDELDKASEEIKSKSQQLTTELDATITDNKEVSEPLRKKSTENKKLSREWNNLVKETSTLNDKKIELKDKLDNKEVSEKDYRNQSKKIYKELSSQYDKMAKLRKTVSTNKMELSRLTNSRETFDKQEERITSEIEELSKQFKDNVANIDKFYSDLKELDKRIKVDKELTAYNSKQVAEIVSDSKLSKYQTNEGIKDYIKDATKEARKLQERINKVNDKEDSKEVLKRRVKESKVGKVVQKATNKIKEKMPKKESKKETDIRLEEEIDTNESSKKAGLNKNLKEESTPSQNKENEVKKAKIVKKTKPIKVNGTTVYDAFDSNDPNFEAKLNNAEIVTEASSNIRELAKVNKEDTSSLNSFADYMDSYEYLLLGQKDATWKDANSASYMRDLANLLGKYYKDKSPEALSALIKELGVKTGEESTTAGYIIDNALNDISAKTNNVLNGLFNTFNKRRMADGMELLETIVKAPTFTEYMEAGSPEELIKGLYDSVKGGKAVFETIKSGKTIVNSDAMHKTAKTISDLIFKERLGNDSLEETYGNVSSYILKSLKDASRFKEIVGKKDKKDSLRSAKEIMRAVNLYFDSANAYNKGKSRVEKEDQIFADNYVDDNFNLVKITEEDVTNDVVNDNTNPAADADATLNRAHVGTKHKREYSVVIANDSTGFDKESGTQEAIPTKALIKESPTLTKIGNKVTLEVDNEYSGDVFYNGHKVKWQDLKRGHTKDTEWLNNHTPIKILMDGEKVGYVPMLSSVNKETIAKSSNLEVERINLRNFRADIADGHTVAEIGDVRKGHLNLVEEFNTPETYSPKLMEKKRSIGVIKNDGIYAGGKRVMTIPKKLKELYNELAGSGVLIVTANDGSLMSSVAYKFKLDGTTNLSETVNSKNSVVDVAEAMKKILDKNSSKKVRNEFYDALNNTVNIKSVDPNNIDLVDNYSILLGIDNMAVFAVKGKEGNIEKFILGNSEKQIEVDATTINKNATEVEEALGMTYYGINDRSLDKRVNLLERNAETNELEVKKSSYNAHLKDKLLSRLVEKTLELPKGNYSESNRRIVKTEKGHSELIFTNNAPVYLEMKGKTEIDKTDVKVVVDKKEVSFNKGESNRAEKVIEDTNKKEESSANINDISETRLKEELEKDGSELDLTDDSNKSSLDIPIKKTNGNNKGC